jgi:hypothetical protein
MGILDDAIREHLELKRKHGVPEEEVERQEEEALGPARREVAQQPEDAEPADEATSAPAAGGDAPTALPFDGDSGAAVTDEAVPAEPTSVPEQAAAPEHALEPVEPPVADHTGLEPPAVEDAPAAGVPAADEPDLEPDPYEALGETEPFPVVEEDEELEEGEDLEEDEELPVSDAEEEDLDVLEDTPDFLQETPEHDRLWFEQKPPRDFDFD